MKHLRAFTLIEMLVAMAVSGIVITAGYVSYGMMSRHYIDFRNNSEEMNEPVVLKGILNHDIHLAKVVKRYSSNEIAAVQNDNASVNYQWNESYVLRKTSIATDTFFLPIQKADMGFARHEQDKAEGLVDEFILTAMVEGQ